MNGPPRKEWWAKRASAYGEGHGKSDLGKGLRTSWAVINEAIAFHKDEYLHRALCRMALDGDVEACALYVMPSADLDRFYWHARNSKQRTQFIDKLIAQALVLRMKA